MLTACAGPASRVSVSTSPVAATPTGVTPPTPVAATAAPAPQAAAPPPPPSPSPTPLPSPSPSPTVVPSPAATPTPEPEPDIQVDLRLWNGSAVLQLDGRAVEPGKLTLPRGSHQAAALVDNTPVAIVDIPQDGGRVEVFVPPPLASLAVMIENQADARPQTGLTSADVVYEALAEGGITRFIAVYLTGDAAVVGPVRSLRHYFAFLAADYGSDLVHIGASPEGFAWRDAMNLGALDESAGDPGVWRVTTRRPPHNAYTDTAADRRLLRDRGRQRNHQWGPLRFAATPPRGEDVAEHLTLGFRPWSYRVAWEWDDASGRYLRFMEGAAHRDAASGEQISVASVVVQFADVEAIPDDEKLRLDVNLVGGSGELTIFSEGRRRGGSWSKDAPRTSTSWLDADGDPLVLPQGPVWVELLPLGSPLAWS